MNCLLHTSSANVILGIDRLEYYHRRSDSLMITQNYLPYAIKHMLSTRGDW